MQGVVEDGPVRCAKALPRAALALLPHTMAASVIQQLVTHCMGIMHEGRADAAGANAVHVLCEVARDHPSQVAGDLNAIVAWVFDTLLPSDAPEAAAGIPGAALTIPPQVLSTFLLPLTISVMSRDPVQTSKQVVSPVRTSQTCCVKSRTCRMSGVYLMQTSAVLTGVYGHALHLRA